MPKPTRSLSHPARRNSTGKIPRKVSTSLTVADCRASCGWFHERALLSGSQRQPALQHSRQSGSGRARRASVHRLPKRRDAAHDRQNQYLLGRSGNDAVRRNRKAHFSRHSMRREPRQRISAFVRLCQLLTAPGGGELGIQNSPIRSLLTPTRVAAFYRRTAIPFQQTGDSDVKSNPP